MSNVTLFKNYTAGVNIPAFRIVAIAANDVVNLATAATDALFGVVQDVSPVAGERVDVAVQGIALVRAQGTVTAGQLLTSNATGSGQNAAPAAGVNNRVIGIALESGTTGDVIRILLSPSSIQG